MTFRIRTQWIMLPLLQARGYVVQPSDGRRGHGKFISFNQIVWC